MRIAAPTHDQRRIAVKSTANPITPGQHADLRRRERVVRAHAELAQDQPAPPARSPRRRRAGGPARRVARRPRRARALGGARARPRGRPDGERHPDRVARAEPLVRGKARR